LGAGEECEGNHRTKPFFGFEPVQFLHSSRPSRPRGKCFLVFQELDQIYRQYPADIANLFFTLPAYDDIITIEKS
jgi:hypothetical protein